MNRFWAFGIALTALVVVADKDQSKNDTASANFIPNSRKGRGGGGGNKGIVVIPTGEAVSPLRTLPKLYVTAGVATATKIQSGGAGGGWGNGGHQGGQGHQGGHGGHQGGGNGWGQSLGHGWGNGGPQLGNSGWGWGPQIGGNGGQMGWGQMGGGQIGWGPPAGWGQGGGWGGGGGGGWSECEDKKAAKAKAKAKKKKAKAKKKAMKKGGGWSGESWGPPPGWGWGGGKVGGGGGGGWGGSGGGIGGGGSGGGKGGWRLDYDSSKLEENVSESEEEDEMWPNAPPPRNARIEDETPMKYNMMDSFPFHFTTESNQVDKEASSKQINEANVVGLKAQIPAELIAQNVRLSNSNNPTDLLLTELPKSIQLKLVCTDADSKGCYYIFDT